MKNETACSFFIWGAGGGEVGGSKIEFNIHCFAKLKKWEMNNEKWKPVFSGHFFSKTDKWQIKICIQFSFFSMKANMKIQFLSSVFTARKRYFALPGSLWSNQQDGSPETEYMRRPDEPQLIMAKQLSTATTPFCFGFYQCCVDVLQSKIWRSTISIAEFSICKCTSLWLTRGCAAGQRKVFVHPPFLKQGIYD